MTDRAPDVFQTSVGRALTAEVRALRDTPLLQLFADDPARAEDFSITLPGLVVDYSKNRISRAARGHLLALARERRVEEQRDAMLRGDRINTSENRAVLHSLLRSDDPPTEVKAVDARLEDFAEAVRNGAWRGADGREITDIVTLGIGGSVLGPRLMTEALTPFHHPRLHAHFVSNVEASHLDTTLARLAPETTLFLVSSKSFTTPETLSNARRAKAWLTARLGPAATARHFAALSTQAAAAEAFGIAPENVFPFWEWVGGRWSGWSAIGLPVMLMIGPEHFRALRRGAGEMDRHFRTAPPAQNLPFLLGLIGIWHRNFCGYPAYTVAPYHTGLARLPAWLQQIDMESNGKRVDRDGRAVPYATGPAVFGEPGTDAQHSFFQWLHQGTDVVPADIVAVLRPTHGSAAEHTALLAHALAQAEALMIGKDDVSPHRCFPGNRPSTTIVLDALTPATLGALMAMYEHKIFVQGAVWGINSFDQWGVELGKVLAQQLEAELTAGAIGAHDPSTARLADLIVRRRKEAP